MNCKDVFDRVDGLLDGTLDGPERAAVQVHLEGCAVCAEELDELRQLREAVDRLPSSLEPPRDLWPAIADRIQSEKVVRGSFGRRALLAAAAVVLLIGSVTAAYFLGRHQAVPIAQVPAPPAVDETSLLLTSFAEIGVDDYLVTRDELLEALEGRRHELSPETQKILTENMRVIEEAMARIAEALDENPEDELLMKQLAGAYRQQIGLLQRAVRLPAEV